MTRITKSKDEVKRQVGWRVPAWLIQEVRIHAAIRAEKMEDLVVRIVSDWVRRETAKRAEKAA